MSALDEIIGKVKDTDRCLYERAMLEIYEMRSGFHFDEAHATESVSRMHSTDAHGSEHRGEHWDYIQVVEAVTPMAGRMGDTDTMWDAYVALNMWWHDLGKNYIRRGEESSIIEDAFTWAFEDEDAPDGKVWRYIRAIG